MQLVKIRQITESYYAIRINGFQCSVSLLICAHRNKHTSAVQSTHTGERVLKGKAWSGDS